MNYTFSYYQEQDYPELLELVLRSYEWCDPFCGLSRLEFGKGFIPAYKGHNRAWERTVALYRENGRLAACVWNEGDYDGELLFLFDSRERAEDRELLTEMLRYAKTFGSDVQRERRFRCTELCVPPWHDTLKELARQAKFQPTGRMDLYTFLPFGEEDFEVKLPDGYSIADGSTTPDFYLSNTHSAAFASSGTEWQGEHGEQAFHDLRKMAHYRKEFDLCVLDPMGRPVAMAILWYDERMPYCELEPLAVAWWERRKGIATALLHEASNRMKHAFPHCGGMIGGDQTFYKSIGYQEKTAAELYHWELEVPISWEKCSRDRRFEQEL